MMSRIRQVPKHCMTNTANMAIIRMPAATTINPHGGVVTWPISVLYEVVHPLLMI